MGIKPLLLSLALTSYPIPVNTNTHTDMTLTENRLCISEHTREVVEGNSLIIDGIMHCRGAEAIQGFELGDCSIGLKKPAEFMLTEMYTSCPFEDTVLDRS